MAGMVVGGEAEGGTASGGEAEGGDYRRWEVEEGDDRRREAEGGDDRRWEAEGRTDRRWEEEWERRYFLQWDLRVFINGLKYLQWGIHDRATMIAFSNVPPDTYLRNRTNLGEPEKSSKSKRSGVGAMTLKVKDPPLVLTTLNEEWANKMQNI
ncbi:hypothetical protein L6452_42890 [Arctium lappa]|uniref:Uncharacterized protein n=1 Tax=Arctium lappa TaxID=4217 RepID=A0ACB8XKM9_ARCLA|nr:hypothetical protein L6452_42890 [Arctium lappa]